jgi:hypothetical protein
LGRFRAHTGANHLKEAALTEDGILSQSERNSLCEGRSAAELRKLIFDGKITINDARQSLAFAPFEGGDVFYKSVQLVAPSAEENAA